MAGVQNEAGLTDAATFRTTETGGEKPRHRAVERSDSVRQRSAHSCSRSATANRRTASGAGEANKTLVAFTFYGTPCTVGLEDRHRFSLSDVDEDNVANAWKQLSSDAYLSVVSECLTWRDRLQLCDWGYVRFLEQMTTAFFPADKLNEARRLQMYILTQSGYKVRIACTDNRLVLLLPSKDNIYEYSYLNIGSCKYYVVEPIMKQRSFYVFDREFPKEQFFSLQIPREPLFSIRASDTRRLTANRYPKVSITVSTNRNLIDFYNDYPLNDA